MSYKNFDDISYNVFKLLNIEPTNIIFYHVLPEVIPCQGKPLDLNNTFINSQYLEKNVFERF